MLLVENECVGQLNLLRTQVVEVLLSYRFNMVEAETGFACVEDGAGAQAMGSHHCGLVDGVDDPESQVAAEGIF